MQGFSNNAQSVGGMIPPFRSYPVACMEIFMLEKARSRQAEREGLLIQQLSYIFDWQTYRNYTQALEDGYTLVVTDIQNTILWVSDRFLSMTGYTPQEAIGRKPNFLQGPMTDVQALHRLSDSIRGAEPQHRRRPIRERLLNYRKCGETYWCDIEIDPIWNNDGELTHFIAVEKEG